MGIKDLLPENQDHNENGKSSTNTPKKRGPGKPRTTTEPQHTFTVRHDVSTKELLDRIKKIKELTTPEAKSNSSGSIIREALALLAKEIKLEEKEGEYAKFLKKISK